ncbi:MAG TPA: hypothetical protein PLF26_13325 [Blastocatellia bacterium]|nr:hypothetical protein [Blastocatellia bacterium]
MSTLLLLVVAYAAGVISSAVWFRKQIHLRDEAAGELERDIIRNAIQHGGRITALDVRSRSAESLEAVEVRLRALHSAGYCESDLDDEGRPIYIFPAFDEAPLRAVRLEKQVLSLARRCEGIVQVSSLTVETDLSYVEARQLLEKMREDGICEPAETPDTFRFFSVRTRPSRSLTE